MKSLGNRIITDSDKELDEGLSMYDSTTLVIRFDLEEKGMNKANLVLSCGFDTILGSLKSA